MDVDSHVLHSQRMSIPILTNPTIYRVDKPLSPMSCSVEVREFYICDMLKDHLYFAYSDKIPYRIGREAAYLFKQYYPDNTLSLDSRLEGLQQR